MILPFQLVPRNSRGGAKMIATTIFHNFRYPQLKSSSFSAERTISRCSTHCRRNTGALDTYRIARKHRLRYLIANLSNMKRKLGQTGTTNVYVLTSKEDLRFISHASENKWRHEIVTVLVHFLRCGSRTMSECTKQRQYYSEADYGTNHAGDQPQEE